MITLKITRYFTNGDAEVAACLTFDVLANSEEKAAAVVRHTLSYEFDLPPLGALWREMTDEEAADYQRRIEVHDE